MKLQDHLRIVATAGLFVLSFTCSALPVAGQMLNTRQAAGSKPKTAEPDDVTRAHVTQAYGDLPLSFEVNRGQTDPQVKFLAHGNGYTLFLTNGEAVLGLSTQTSKSHAGAHKAYLRMKLLGANPTPAVSGIEELPGKSNYFIGNDPKKWRTDVRNYARVQYQSIYPGIDLIYYGNQGQLEYDFVVAPGSDPKDIALDVEPEFVPANKMQAGEVPLQIARDGDLVVRLAGEEIRFHKPVAYQDVSASTSQSNSAGRKLIEARYVLEARNQVGIRLAAYDSTRPLVIDPVVWYSTYLGGSGIDQAGGLAVDHAGNVYVTGFTTSGDFPRVNQIAGACNGSCGTTATFNAFVTKVSASGKLLLYSSYIGGSGDDQGSGIAVDGTGNAYLTGGTSSSDFPRLHQIPGACNGSCGSGHNLDSFVTKINAAGNSLVYSSLVGGSGDDSNSYNTVFFNNIAVDRSGNAYLTGQTYSTNFPRVNQIPGACNGSCGSGFPGDIFVTKVNAAGTALVYSSYLGGDAADIGYSIAVDGSGNAYVTGLTYSADFPRVNQISGACQGTCGTGANYDAFVVKIDAAGSALVYSSYLGGSEDEWGRGIAVDSSGAAYVVGAAGSGFPQVNQIAGACAHDSCGAFAAKINAAGSSLVYSSRFGGSRGADQGLAVAVDSSGSAYVLGGTQSSDFPRVNQLIGTCRGSCGTGTNYDAFVMKINAAGDALVYSSYIGGSGDDNGGSLVGNASIALDSTHNAYLSGFTISPDFPLVPKSIPGACIGSCGTAGNGDAFVIKISP